MPRKWIKIVSFETEFECSIKALGLDFSITHLVCFINFGMKLKKNRRFCPNFRIFEV